MKMSWCGGAALICSLLLVVSVSNAQIIDLGNVTRDNDTGLNWLDVTETRGLSYNQVLAMMVPGGSLEGWRYATTAELDQLIINFGYTAVSVCVGTHLHCDLAVPGDSVSVESFIKTLGDTWDANVDSFSGPYNTDANGAGWTQGLIDGNNKAVVGGKDYAMIADSEHIVRSTGAPAGDADDIVHTAYGGFTLDQTSAYIGSFLVQDPTQSVPEYNAPIGGLAVLFAMLLAIGVSKRWMRNSRDTPISRTYTGQR